jgi:hypothetical protein
VKKKFYGVGADLRRFAARWLSLAPDERAKIFVEMRAVCGLFNPSHPNK